MKKLLFLATPFLFSSAWSSPKLIEVSSDPYTNSTSQHESEVEPDNFAFGSTIVSAFQVGRFKDGGSSNIGFSTSTDGGQTWKKGFLPGLTKFEGGGPYDRASDPVVAYDAAHKTWMISTLPIKEGGFQPVGAGVMVSLSNDGLTWGSPVSITLATGANSFLDKNWTACDNNSKSPYYGHCYTEWDDAAGGMQIFMSTSTDGGKTWSTPARPSARGLGGQPIIQPNGTLVVPYAEATFFETSLKSFRSTDGGRSWNSAVDIATPESGESLMGGQFRAPEELMSVDVDSKGTIYAAWSDCRFNSGCKANDIVFVTSTDGNSWSKPARVPISNRNSGRHYMIPGLGVDPASANGRISLTYYYANNPSCSGSNCTIGVGSISSPDGGKNWGAAVDLTPDMNIDWVPDTTQGHMVGDYISTAFLNGMAFPIFAVAYAPQGSKLNVAMNSIQGGLAVVEEGIFPLDTGPQVYFGGNQSKMSRKLQTGKMVLTY